MKISISNIAWSEAQDEDMYDFLRKNQVEGIEIAPTRIFPENPYEKLKDAREFGKKIYEQYGLCISSMQSIWYGREERIFEDDNQRKMLIEYTKKAFEFAHVLNCRNLVFGCPKNRNINCDDDKKVAQEFFQQLGELAEKEETVLALEANPPIYNTNFMNTMQEVLEIVRKVNSPGIQINYDLGTTIQNGEDVFEIEKILKNVNHVHISEPHLAEIKIGEIQKQLVQILKKNKYSKYISIEMKNLGNIEKVQNVISGIVTLVRS